MRWYLHAVLSQVQAAEAARSAENSYAKDEGTPEDTQALVLRGVRLRRVGTRRDAHGGALFGPGRGLDNSGSLYDVAVFLAVESEAALAQAGLPQGRQATRQCVQGAARKSRTEEARGAAGCERNEEERRAVLETDEVPPCQ